MSLPQSILTMTCTVAATKDMKSRFAAFFGEAAAGNKIMLSTTKITDGCTCCTVTLERTFDDVTKQGKIEGLTFDKETNSLLLLYNRGARIVLGMPKGFYDGYDREISEVFIYSIAD